MLFYLTSELSMLYTNLNRYHQVGFGQLDLVKDVSDQGKGGVCRLCMLWTVWSLNSKHSMILHYYSI